MVEKVGDFEHFGFFLPQNLGEKKQFDKYICFRWRNPLPRKVGFKPFYECSCGEGAPLASSIQMISVSPGKSLGF